MFKKTASYFLIAAIAMLSAFNYAIFIFPNHFAPSGIDGICTMIQDTTGVSIGYFSLLANVPLVLIAFFGLNRDFAIKSTLYILVFSLSSIIIRRVTPVGFGYHAGAGNGVLLAVIAAGVVRGILYAFTLNLNGSSGGIDIIAATVKKKRPYLDLMNVIFFINLFIATISFFVYGMRLEPVICSILYSFITSSVSSRIRAGKHRAMKYEIITSEAEELCAQIKEKLNQTATVIDAKGAFSHADKKMVVFVSAMHNVPYVEEIILTIRDPFVFKSVVDNSVIGIDYK